MRRREHTHTHTNTAALCETSIFSPCFKRQWATISSCAQFAGPCVNLLPEWMVHVLSLRLKFEKEKRERKKKGGDDKKIPPSPPPKKKTLFTGTGVYHKTAGPLEVDHSHDPLLTPSEMGCHQPGLRPSWQGEMSHVFTHIISNTIPA